MEESREQFERWLKKEMPMTYRLAYEPSEDDEEEMIHHAKSHVLDMRQAWSASRAALVVEQWDFDTFSPNDCGDDAVWMTEVKRTLGKAGITVKGEGDEQSR